MRSRSARLQRCVRRADVPALRTAPHTCSLPTPTVTETHSFHASSLHPVALPFIRCPPSQVCVPCPPCPRAPRRAPQEPLHTQDAAGQPLSAGDSSGPLLGLGAPSLYICGAADPLISEHALAELAGAGRLGGRDVRVLVLPVRRTEGEGGWQGEGGRGVRDGRDGKPRAADVTW